MKITKTQLKQLIKEEITKVMDEAADTASFPAHTRYLKGTPFAPPSKQLSPQEQEAALRQLGARPEIMDQAAKIAKGVGIGIAEALNFLIFMATAGGIDLTGGEAGPYRGTDDPSMGTRYGESIDRDKFTTLVAEEVQRILKNK